MALIPWLLNLVREDSTAEAADWGNRLFHSAVVYGLALLIAAWRCGVGARDCLRARLTPWLLSLLNERRDRRMAERGKSVICEFDLEGRVTCVSPTAGKMTGHRPEAMQGRLFSDFLPEAEVPRIIQAFITVMMGERIRGVETEMISGEGFSIPVEAHFMPLLRDMEVVGVRGCFYDLRETKRPEAVYRTLARSSLAGVYIVQRGKLKLVNPQFLRWTGYVEKELIDMDPLRLVHPEDREMVNRRAVMMLKGQRVEPYEFRLLARDGTIRRVKEIVTSVAYKGHRAVLGNYIDVTDPIRRGRGETSGLSAV